MKRIFAAALPCLALAPNLALAAPTSPFPAGYGPVYQAYLAALPPAYRKQSWLTKLDELGTPAEPLAMGATTVTYLFGCKQHACDTDQTNIFLYPDRKRFAAVIKVGGKQTLLGSAGPRELACLKVLEASNGTAKRC